MDGIEQRVRDSLQARATDVAPTPMLWQEVDRRITRRKRLRLSVLAVAGSAAVVLGVLVLPGLLGGGISPIEIEPFVEPEPPADEAPAETVDPGPASEGTPVLVADQNAIRLLGPDGDVVLHTFDPEGEVMFVTGLAVRPGSTVDDLTAAVMTMSEGYEDLRELRVIDGEVSLGLVPERYRPASRPSSVETASVSLPVWSPDGGQTGAEESSEPYLPASPLFVGAGSRISNPVWSPNGDALAWLEEGDGQVALRIIGWSDGPGTGNTADDNTSFVLQGLPSMLNLNDWVEAGPDTTLIRGTIDDGGEGMYVIPVDRQADGAWSMDKAPELIALDPEAGAVNAVAGSPGADGRSVRYAVRLGSERFVLTVDGADEVELPGDLLPSGEGGGDGLASLWVIDLGDRALVGSRSTSTAYLVDSGGELTRIDGAAAGDGVR